MTLKHRNNTPIVEEESSVGLMITVLLIFVLIVTLLMLTN